ncbi:hypothetical protein [Streptomyces sp. NPDC058157]|uniref:hypothetical protein n=1 Tax=Streptomyces sp. NPDC058157 TaxID=3346360 RepID=UPI0036EB3069
MAAADASFDDLAPLGRLIGSARIVALEGGSHRILEHGLIRDRILRFLIQEWGFTVYAAESRDHSQPGRRHLDSGR